VQPAPNPASSSASTSASTIDLQQSTLTLELTGLRNREGVICFALFNSPDGFPSNPDRAMRSGCFTIDSLPCELHFENLPFGWYAVAVHHDENMDGKLNCNALGIPKEGIGFSGNPRIWMGAPSFQKAAFEFSPDFKQISITMRYLAP
jgi:uncharacterized protein (DUF2141 family)